MERVSEPEVGQTVNAEARGQEVSGNTRAPDALLASLFDPV